MFHRLTGATLALVLLSFAGVEKAGAAPPASMDVITVTPTTPATYTGNTASGSNVEYNFSTGEPCVEDQTMPTAYCDLTLLEVDLASDPTFWDTHGGGVQVRLFDYTVPSSDFDLQIWTSNADGEKGDELVGSSGNPPGSLESTTISEPADGFYLIQVVYFAVTNSSYELEAKFVTRDEIPPDVDNPPGLQESLASDPSKGFRSMSEMHLAQNPLDPNMLIAGSKFYNKDLLDSLGEYEFKVGTYVSFDRGHTWTDLGQTAVCPPPQSPPESWTSDSHTCYPEDDPNRDGLDEVEQGSAQHPQDGEYGEEYITSDPWLAFDDEGNAYFMMLDHPPFDLDPEGTRWGMSMHRWDSVSQNDLVTGETWGPRMPINQYEDDVQGQLGFLDDKNTFALNNAGPDLDGETGTLISCWGQNISALIKQQVVCNRSTDQAESWSQPVPVSDVQQLVIGPHVIPDNADPQAFYVVWLQYASEVATGEATLQFSRTVDGGQTWTPSVPVTTLTGIPRQFPGQAFRNLSIPIMDVAPNGDLYIAISEYVAASDPTSDEDGMEADIVLYRSTNSGATWSQVANVTETAGPNMNADQFQPYISIVKGGEGEGQLNIVYFDRRHDTPSPPEHPGNYFVDVYLSRSNDGGETFTDVRMSHDMMDPQYNAPVSGSGLFFGDYQGLVADECGAIAFVNDSHLANDEFLDPSAGERDPEFDLGFPSSPYQQATSWDVANTTGFGGTQASLPASCIPPPPTICPDVSQVAGNHIIGGPGSETLVGTQGKDVICGQGGNDVIRGLRGADVLLGGTGNDRVIGGKHADQLRGDAGKDVLRGGKHGDDLRGGKGRDRIGGGKGNDNLRGQKGRDKLRGGKGNDFLRGGKGKDRCKGGRGRDVQRGCLGGTGRNR